MRAWPASVAVLCCLTLVRPDVAAPVPAQDEAARTAARALAEEGAHLFEQDDFQGALDKFKQAFDRFPTPKLFLNMGQSLRSLSRNLEALEAFERFLAEAKDASPEFIDVAKARVAELKAKLSSISVECDRAGTVVTLDGQERGEIPLGKLLVVEPGLHKLSVTWEGETKSVEVEAIAGRDLLLTFEFPVKKPLPEPIASKPEPQLLPSAERQEIPPEAPVARKHTWYWVAGGAVVAAMATTLIILYGRSDRYPEADLGTRKLGGVR